MSKNNILFGVIGLFAGLVISFILTNAFYRGERDMIERQTTRSATKAEQAEQPYVLSSLSEDEIVKRLQGLRPCDDIAFQPTSALH